MSGGTPVTAALAQFQTLPLKDAARQLFATLGYESDRFLPGLGSAPQDFLNHFSADRPFDPDKALVSEWTSADLLFQLTDQELSREYSLFTDDSVQSGLLKSYIFVAIGLKDREYARGKFSAVARQINRLFPMPVMVLFKHGDRLTIAVINRRRNKLDDSRDVLEKATLIRDISFAQPHRGHLDILDSLALPNLVHPQKKPITDFDTLHAAWEQIFNVELLNERFYRELANWYFWALPQVEFPDDLEPNEEKRRATGLIRLLTRLIFCWFIKEKNLIPEELFHPADLAKILKGFDPESETGSTYYLAILQNLFFATLNQRMGKDGSGKPHRAFARDEGFQKNRDTYDVNTLYRYESLFAVSEEEALALFADIPFLNGGLFECLDRTEDGTNRKLYLDGFSRNAKKRPHVPDRLFFDSGETADLSAVYGDKKRKSEKVTGLITLLNRYKFTIVENTPIDQEIALDPELLGKVFENLLASYNEETKTTARKQTGSFYTPRPIVDYMVDESLKAHLKQKVEQQQKVGQTFLSASSSPSSSPSNETLTITRRDLPHWKKDGSIYWVTFRMADSLPQEKLKAWKAERDLWTSHHPEPWDDQTWDEYNERFGDKLDQWLDAGMGSRALARSDVREAVKSCLLKFHGERLLVHSAVIMPNHVHALIEPLPGHDLSKLLQGIKGAGAREANRLLGTSGTFWLDESYDHIVRSEAQYHHFLRYIQENPLKPGLKPTEYWLKEGAQGAADIPVCVSSACTSSAKQGDADIPVCASSAKQGDADIPVCASSAKQGAADIPVCASSASSVCDSSLCDPFQNGQTGMSAPHSAPLSRRLDQLFSYTDEPHLFSDAEVACLIAAIDSLKVLDPACGSGAFPMGVLHKLVYILGKLDPDNERWKQTQLAKLDSPPMREELERAFADNNDDYGRKLYLIENCLYGVDIQPVAIQITKLRFFISLVCDQRTNRSKRENHGIRPLPNLETKFVAADTLIGLPELDQMVLAPKRAYDIESEIESIYHSHFSEQNRSKKMANQRKIKGLRQELGKVLAESLMASKKAQHIADWDPFDPQSSADFFDPQWMFGRCLKDGFDIVLGNPPYVDSETMTRNQPQMRQLYASIFSAAKGNWDLFILFIEKGYGLLAPSGLVSFIVPNKLLSAPYSEGIRTLMGVNCIHEMRDYSRVRVFKDADVYPIVFVAEKCKPYIDVKMTVMSEVDAIDSTDVISKSTFYQDISWDRYFMGDAAVRIDAKCLKHPSLSEYFPHISGAATVSEAYEFKDVVKEWDDLFTKPYKRLINTGTVDRYCSLWGIKRTRYLKGSYERPIVSDDDIRQVNRSRLEQARKAKVIIGGMTKELECFYDNGEYLAGKSTVIVLEGRKLHLKCALALLNSRLISYWYQNHFKSMSLAGGYLRIGQNEIRAIPIPEIDQKQSADIISLVDRILSEKDERGNTADTSALEREIDQQVYALYGLTPEEIAIVEGAVK